MLIHGDSNLWSLANDLIHLILNLKRDGFAEEGEIGVNLVPIAEAFGEGFTLAVFPVGQDNAGTAWGERIEPVEQIGLSGVGTKSTQGVNPGLDRYLFAEDGDKFFSIDQLASQRPVALVSDDDHVAIRFPKIIAQVVHDTPGIAHTGSGQNQERPRLIVDPFGFVWSRRHDDLCKVRGERSTFQVIQ